MAEDTFNEGEGKEWLKKYEDMINGISSSFLDIDAYEYIITHYISKNNILGAKKACEVAMESFPYSTELLVDYAHVLATNGETDQAWQIIKKAETFHPYDVDLVLLKSILMNQEGKVMQSLEYLIEMEPVLEEKYKIHLAIASTLQQIGRFKESAVWFQKGLRKDPFNEESLNEFSIGIEHSDNPLEYLDFIQEIIDKNPYYFPGWLAISTIYNKARKFDEAIEALDYALAIKEDNPVALFQKGNVYMNMEKYNEAQIAFKEALKLDEGNPELLVSIGAAYENLEKFDQAIYYYRKALKSDPEFADAHYGIGICLLELEKFTESLHFFNKAIQINAEIEDYWLGKAEAEFELGNVLTAIEAYETVLQLNPAIPDLWLDWSYIYYDQGDFEKAISLITSGVDELPEDSDLYYRAVVYLLTAGKFKEAFIYLENALILDFDGHVVLYEFFEDINTQKALFKIIEQFKDNKKNDK